MSLSFQTKNMPLMEKARRNAGILQRNCKPNGPKMRAHINNDETLSYEERGKRVRSMCPSPVKTIEHASANKKNFSTVEYTYTKFLKKEQLQKRLKLSGINESAASKEFSVLSSEKKLIQNVKREEIKRNNPKPADTLQSHESKMFINLKRELTTQVNKKREIKRRAINVKSCEKPQLKMEAFQSLRDKIKKRKSNEMETNKDSQNVVPDSTLILDISSVNENTQSSIFTGMTGISESNVENPEISVIEKKISDEKHKAAIQNKLSVNVNEDAQNKLSVNASEDAQSGIVTDVALLTEIPENDVEDPETTFTVEINETLILDKLSKNVKDSRNNTEISQSKVEDAGNKTESDSMIMHCNVYDTVKLRRQKKESNAKLQQRDACSVSLRNKNSDTRVNEVEYSNNKGKLKMHKRESNMETGKAYYTREQNKKAREKTLNDLQGVENDVLIKKCSVSLTRIDEETYRNSIKNCSVQLERLDSKNIPERFPSEETCADALNEPLYVCGKGIPSKHNVPSPSSLSQNSNESEIQLLSSSNDKSKNPPCCSEECKMQPSSSSNNYNEAQNQQPSQSTSAVVNSVKDDLNLCDSNNEDCQIIAITKGDSEVSKNKDGKSKSPPPVDTGNSSNNAATQSFEVIDLEDEMDTENPVKSSTPQSKISLNAFNKANLIHTYIKDKTEYLKLANTFVELKKIDENRIPPSFYQILKDKQNWVRYLHALIKSLKRKPRNNNMQSTRHASGDADFCSENGPKIVSIESVHPGVSKNSESNPSSHNGNADISGLFENREHNTNCDQLESCNLHTSTSSALAKRERSSSPDVEVLDCKDMKPVNFVQPLQQRADSQKQGPQTPEPPVFLCTNCKERAAAYACPLCSMAFFCSDKCGRDYWDKGHSENCNITT